jgi:hypothetical protein
MGTAERADLQCAVCVCVVQVSHPEDTRNFSGAPEDAHPAGSKTKHYVSTGVFKDF